MMDGERSGKYEKPINASGVAANILLFAEIVGKECGATPLPEVLLDGHDEQIKDGLGHSLYLGFSGNRDALVAVEEEFNAYYVRYHDVFPRHVATREASVSDGKIFIDVSPMIDNPKIIAQILETHSRRGAMRWMGAGALLSLCGLGMTTQAAVDNNLSAPIRLAEGAAGAAAIIQGPRIVHKAGQKFALPGVALPMDAMINNRERHAAVVAALVKYYDDRDIPFEITMEPDTGRTR